MHFWLALYGLPLIVFITSVRIPGYLVWLHVDAVIKSERLSFIERAGNVLTGPSTNGQSHRSRRNQ